MTLSVSELNEYVRRSLASDPMIQHISIKGEISNFKSYASGHWYFTLKDTESAISCVMFSQYNSFVDFLIEDGMAVELKGNVSLYTKTGQYQFYAENITPLGIGVLFKKYEELKNKLFNEGLFDESIKKPLPLFSKRIGVISSKSGAVIHDIINVTRLRNNAVSILLYPSSVQGKGTAVNVVAGIDYFNKMNNVDIIIIARGGGSFEDLFEFNDEYLARRVRSSNIPIISAVGHETDFTILDFVADQRAATPSQAAEIAVVRSEQLISTIKQLQERCKSVIKITVVRYRDKIDNLNIKLLNFNSILKLYRSKIKILENSISNRVRNEINGFLQKLKLIDAKIKLINPEYIVNKGYAIIRKNHKVISNIDEIFLDDTLTVELKDGIIDTTVRKVNYGKKEKNI